MKWFEEIPYNNENVQKVVQTCNGNRIYLCPYSPRSESQSPTHLTVSGAFNCSEETSKAVIWPVCETLEHNGRLKFPHSHLNTTKYGLPVNNHGSTCTFRESVHELWLSLCRFLTARWRFSVFPLSTDVAFRYCRRF